MREGYPIAASFLVLVPNRGFTQKSLNPKQKSTPFNTALIFNYLHISSSVVVVEFLSRRRRQSLLILKQKKTKIYKDTKRTTTRAFVCVLLLRIAEEKVRQLASFDVLEALLFERFLLDIVL